MTERPGGRSARVRAAVLDAAAVVLAERGPDGLTVAEVAARAGVNPTSIYRRWGGPSGLVVDVQVQRIERDLPLPDTGSLRGDLLAYARQTAASIGDPHGLAFLRAIVANVDDGDRARRGTVLFRRAEGIQAMLDRAAERGEPRLHWTAVVDGILAPLYLRRLLDVGGVDDAYLAGLADRTIVPR